ncbi:unnamed protein product [Alopecurus aequalis]
MKKLSLLYIAMVILVLCCPMCASSTESLHGLRMLQETKANLSSGATTQTINVEEVEFVHTGSIGFELTDYPGSGANNRHSPHSEGTR